MVRISARGQAENERAEGRHCEPESEGARRRARIPRGRKEHERRDAARLRDRKLPRDATARRIAGNHGALDPHDIEEPAQEVDVEPHRVVAGRIGTGQPKSRPIEADDAERIP